MGQFRLVDVGVAAALAAAAVTAFGLAKAVGASGGTPSVFVPITPCRLLDTRAGTDNVGTRATPIGAGEAATFAVWGTNGACTIPNTATGIATNTTAVNPTAASYVTVYPADAIPRPTASNLNFTAGSAPTPNQVTVGLSAAGAIGVFNHVGTVDLVIDIVGYYQALPPTTTVPPTPLGGTLVYTGQALQEDPPPAASTFDGRGGCRTLPSLVSGYLDLVLPIGAKITSIVIRYVDGNPSATLSIDLYEVTTPGAAEVNPSATLMSVDGATSGTMSLSGQLPVGADAAPYLFMSSNGTILKFCGARVTYTM